MVGIEKLVENKSKLMLISTYFTKASYFVKFDFSIFRYQSDTDLSTPPPPPPKAVTDGQFSEIISNYQWLNEQSTL